MCCTTPTGEAGLPQCARLAGPNVGLAEIRRVDRSADSVVLDRVDFAEQQRDLGVVVHAGYAVSGCPVRQTGNA